MPSQTLRYSRGFVLNRRAAVLIVVWCLTAVASVQAQTPSPPAATPNISREDQQLTEARRQNEEAQAEYYRTQTRKLNEPVAAKSFWRTLSDNAAILGALTAALVALFTLIVNQRTALRARKDTEFYEALKRFGDKDSPTVRASAAGMLTRISQTYFVNFPRRRPDRRWRDLQKKRWQKPTEWIKKRTVSYPYFETTLDQLVTGLSIEDHAVVVAAITDALAQLIPFNRDRAATQLYIANRRLQVQFVEQLAWVVALFADDDKWKQSKKVWKLVTSYTGYPREAFEDMPDLHRAEFNVARQGASLTVRTTDQNSRRSIEDVARRRLKDIGSRLRQNVALLVQSFVKDKVYSFLDLTGVFLAGAQFPRESNLSGIILDLAVLCDAKLAHSDLRGASLVMSRLEGADLLNAKLEDSSLSGARIDNRTVFLGSNWWKANFITWFDLLHPGFIDSRKLLDDLALRGSLSPERMREAHLSVRKHFEALPRSASNVKQDTGSES